MAVSAIPGGFRAAVVNHHPEAREITLRPLDMPAGAGDRAEWSDLATGAPIPERGRRRRPEVDGRRLVVRGRRIQIENEETGEMKRETEPKPDMGRG